MSEIMDFKPNKDGIYEQENKQKKKQRQYYLDHKEQEKARARKYYKEHREEILEYRKEYRRKNPEHEKGYQKKWRLDNKEKVEKYNEQYYIDNKEKITERAKLKYRKVLDWTNNYKLSHGCAICGYKVYAVALDFHHTGDDKKFEIGSKLGGKTIESVKMEAEKCIVLCANCHRVLHWKESFSRDE